MPKSSKIQPFNLTQLWYFFSTMFYTQVLRKLTLYITQKKIMIQHFNLKKKMFKETVGRQKAWQGKPMDL